jgi:hypothetical protein
MKKKLSKILGISLSIALMTSLLVAAAPAVAISTPSVDVSPATITKDATYTIEFDVTKQLTGNGTLQDTITITFPAGTVVAAPTATIVIGPGWVDNGTGPVWDAVPDDISGGTWTYSATERWIKYELPAGGVYVGSSAEVRVEITDGITNPDAPGDYTLDVATSQETTAKTSSTYEITTPTIDPLSGIVSAYNAEGILMAQSHEIQECIDEAGPGGTIEVGPGTYTYPWDLTVAADHEGQTIVGIGEPGTCIIKSTSSVNIDVDDVTIDGLTFNPGGGSYLIDIDGEDVTVTNCDFSAGTAYSAPVGTIIYVNGTDTAISNCTFDLTRSGGQYGIDVYASTADVSDCTFDVGTDDEAVYTDASADISGITVTGNSGYGVDVSSGCVTIDASTFTSLTNAIYNSSGEVWLSDSVVDGCGSASYGAIENYDVLYMVNNTVQNTHEDAAGLYLYSNFSAIHFNSFLNNEVHVEINTSSGMDFLENNWWGSADGPAPGTVLGVPDALAPYLGNSITNADLAVDVSGPVDTLITKDTVGIDVAILPGPSDDDGEVWSIGVAQYADNPELTPPTIMGTGSVVGYYDVFVANNGEDDDVVQVKFYVPVTPYTKVYYAGGISGRWADAGGDVNLASGFAYVTIGGIDSGLTVEDLGGTVFAIVEDKTTEAGPVQTSPTIGGYDVATEPMFTWNGVPGSIRYEIALSEDPTFTIIEWSYNVDQTFYKVDEPLRYDTTYYWRVRGVLGEPYQEGGVWLTPATPWTTGIFTTAAEPEPPAEPIVVQPTKPEVNVEIPPTKITIEPAEQAIPNYMLWIIVVVGAILIIALIVLIVRTRRVV